LKDSDEEAADKTEDDDVALHDGAVKKYNGDNETRLNRLENRRPEAQSPGPFKERDSIHDGFANGVLGSAKTMFWASGRLLGRYLSVKRYHEP
jgi:hypothetical protein